MAAAVIGTSSGTRYDVATPRYAMSSSGMLSWWQVSVQVVQIWGKTCGVACKGVNRGVGRWELPRVY